MGPFSRRDVLRGGRDLATLLSLSTLAGVESPLVAPAEAAQDGTRAPSDVYRSIGVKPLVNARGTFTIISGSLMLPEVRSAMDAAARHYVHLDELAEAVGARAGSLTVPSGGSSHPMLGGADARNRRVHPRGNPDLHVRLPEPDGFAKEESIIPGTFPKGKNRRSGKWAPPLKKIRAKSRGPCPPRIINFWGPGLKTQY